ncbi:MAG: TonB-dependent receptor plug domain-containing protein, partial [Pseudomonadota bacterium]
MALAQDAGDDELEEIIVTGSRIPADVLDAPRPISTITRAEIDLSGLEDVASLLRTTTFNSFGSFRERSGSSFGQIALVNLRGLGEDRTAVLINGRRVPGNPLTGTSAVDLNSIPLAAVEQIEILTDSASAVYGADAIGGVINVIMRDDFDGLELEAGAEFPEREGADAEHVNVTFGTTNERSSILFSAEWYKKDPIFDADRDYSQVQIAQNPSGGDPRHNVDTIGVSSGGNTGFALDFSDAFRVGNCPTDRYIPLSDPEGIPGALGCGFG